MSQKLTPPESTSTTKSQREIWDNWQAPDSLEECVRFMFERLDATEESDNGRVFHPTTFSSCRVWDSHRLNKVFIQMKKLTNR